MKWYLKYSVLIEVKSEDLIKMENLIRVKLYHDAFQWIGEFDLVPYSLIQKWVMLFLFQIHYIIGLSPEDKNFSLFF